MADTKEPKPKLFIGSARESKKYAAAVHRELKHYAEVTPWYAGVFKANNATMDDLETQVDKNDFGVFVFSPDDVIELREKVMLAPRDNTIFEMGLFWGKLKRDRVYFIVPESVSKTYGEQEITEFHIPSDLHGLTLLTYEIRPDNYDAAVSTACDVISGKIEKLKSYPRHKASLTEFMIEFSKDMMKEPEKKYDFLADAIRIAYDTSSVKLKVTGAAIWQAQGNDCISQVAGNVGRNRSYSFNENEGKGDKEPRVLVVDAYLTNTEQAVLYKKHVANVYLLCYPVGKELVITLHLSGQVSQEELIPLMDENDVLLSTINYLFGGESI